jgi:hypothetical protein
VGTVGLTLGRLYALPLRLRAGTYRGLAFNVAAAPSGGAACRQALYSDSNGQPGAVLAENVAAVANGSTGTQYNDFTGGDYTAAADMDAWVAMTCGTLNAMAVTVATQTTGTQPYQADELGSSVPLGTAGNDAGLYSSVITTYPATSLAATNSGNFGAVTYSGALPIPLSSIRAR